MKASKKIYDYLPDRMETALFQCNINKRILLSVRKQKDKDGYSWRKLVEACFQRYLDEAKDKKK